MRPGPLTPNAQRRIEYKELRKINPEAARLAVLEYLKTNNRNICEAARVFGINRPVIYDIIGNSRRIVDNNIHVLYHTPFLAVGCYLELITRLLL